MFNPDLIETAFAPDTTKVLPPQRLLRPDGFQLPAPIWHAMFVAYGIFFGALWLTLRGDGEAVFAIAISVLYTVIYFGTARILAGVAGPDRDRPLERGSDVLQTWTGPMSHKAVAAQILVVPLCLAVFGIGVAVIRAFVV